MSTERQKSTRTKKNTVGAESKVAKRVSELEERMLEEVRQRWLKHLEGCRKEDVPAEDGAHGVSPLSRMSGERQESNRTKESTVGDLRTNSCLTESEQGTIAEPEGPWPPVFRRAYLDVVVRNMKDVGVWPAERSSSGHPGRSDS